MNNILLLSADGNIAVDSDIQPRWFDSSALQDTGLEALSPPICIDMQMGDGCLYAQLIETFPESIVSERFRSVLLNQDDDEKAERLTRAKQLLHWYSDNMFCGRCGAEMHIQTPCTEPAKTCVSCSFSVYPRISPCVICLIYKGDKILLARPTGRTSGFYSLIAGFIEAGETAEQAVSREIYEEVGLKVKNVQYLLSQSWPFSHSLMLGFTAEYDSGAITFIDGEIGEADWFSLDNLPELPPSGTVATKLVKAFLQQF